MTADLDVWTITNERPRELIAESREGRQTKYKRTFRMDCEAALAGDACCRASVAKISSPQIRLPPSVVAAIEAYLSTNWQDGCDLLVARRGDLAERNQRWAASADLARDLALAIVREAALLRRALNLESSP